MNQTTLAVFGIASFVLNTVGLVPYIRDIFLRKTKPERASWWIWLALNLIAFFAQLAAGATWSLLMTAASIVAVLVIAVLSLRYGYGTFHRRDLISLLIAMFGLVLWKFTHQPFTALLIVIGLDLLSFWLTLSKSWRAPYTETLSAWVLASMAGVLGLLAVGSWNPTQLIYPVYVAAANWLLVGIIIYRRSHKKPTALANL